MNMLQFQHLGFFMKSVSDMEFVIFHLDHVLISLAKCLVDMTPCQTTMDVVWGSTSFKCGIEID
jgi:hypothetical protein